MLGEFGSPRAEAELLRHYTSWSEKWAARDAELTPVFAENGPQRDEASVGFYLLQAFTTGQSWLTDAVALQRLMPLARGARLRQMMDDALRRWSNQPLTITVNHIMGSQPFDGHVAQYQCRSLEAFEQKLAQFPAGTKCAFPTSGPDTPMNRATDAALRTFMGQHQLVIAEK